MSRSLCAAPAPRRARRTERTRRAVSNGAVRDAGPGIRERRSVRTCRALRCSRSTPPYRFVRTPRTPAEAAVEAAVAVAVAGAAGVAVAGAVEAEAEAEAAAVAAAAAAGLAGR